MVLSIPEVVRERVKKRAEEIGVERHTRTNEDCEYERFCTWCGETLDVFCWRDIHDHTELFCSLGCAGMANAGIEF